MSPSRNTTIDSSNSNTTSIPRSNRNDPIIRRSRRLATTNALNRNSRRTNTGSSNLSHPQYDNNYGGRRSNNTIDGVPRRNTEDRRIGESRKLARTSIGRRPNRRTNDESFDSVILCCKCQEYLPRREFKNRAIRAPDNSVIGFNINCRSCNGSNYSNGHRENDFTVCDSDDEINSDDEEYIVSDDEDSDEEESDDDF